MVSLSSLVKVKNFFVELGLAIILIIAVAISDIEFHLWKLRKRLSNA